MSEAAHCTDNQAMLSLLLTRWSQGPKAAAPAVADGHQPVGQARYKLEQALADYLPWMDAPDKALYDRLMRARHVDELGALFFRCFDLMVRTRGTAIAVLRMHELYRLLQPHIGR